jgi:enoyl-CoA hydratase/carnithine racemase
MDDKLLTRVENGIGVLTFNMPEVMNAVDPAYLLRVIDAFKALDADPQVKAIVVTGAGRGFCAGATRDFLKNVSKMPAHEIRDTVYASFQGVTRSIKLSEKPTIAAVNGPAIGAGCEFALAPDLRVTTQKAFFQENWIDLGLIPPLGGMFLLPRMVGLERASNMILRSERIYGEQAVAIGLASECVDPDKLLPRAIEMARDLASKPRAAMKIARQGLRRGMDGTLAGEWEFNVQAQAILLNGPDFREFAASVEEGRKPVYK